MAGGGGVVLADPPEHERGGGFGEVEPFYTVPIALGGVMLLAAVLLVSSRWRSAGRNP